MLWVKINFISSSIITELCLLFFLFLDFLLVGQMGYILSIYFFSLSLIDNILSIDYIYTYIQICIIKMTIYLYIYWVYMYIYILQNCDQNA